jgi:phage protein U
MWKEYAGKKRVEIITRSGAFFPQYYGDKMSIDELEVWGR